MRRYIVLLSMVAISFAAIAQTRIWNDKLDGKNRGVGKGKQESTIGLHTTQYDGIHHLLGLYVDGAFATFMTNNKLVQLKPFGYGAGLGFVYCYHNGTIIVQTGIGARWQDVRDSVSIAPYTTTVIDSWGSAQELTYTQTQRVDAVRNLYLEVPLYVGTYFGGGFYVQAGPKVMLQLYGNTGVNTVMTTTAEYPGHFVGTAEQMDNHGLRDQVPLSAKHEALKMRLDLAASVEIGYEFPFSNKGKRGYRKQTAMDERVRVAAFADLGIMNMRQTSYTPATTIPEATRYDFGTFDFHHIFADEASASYAFRNVFAGVRVTFFFFGRQSKEPCLQCGVRGGEKRFKTGF